MILKSSITYLSTVALLLAIILTLNVEIAGKELIISVLYPSVVRDPDPAGVNVAAVGYTALATPVAE